MDEGEDGKPGAEVLTEGRVYWRCSEDASEVRGHGRADQLDRMSFKGAGLFR